MKIARPFYFLAFLMLVFSGCVNQNAADDLSTTPTSSESGLAIVKPGTSTYFTINEVGLGPNGFVSLTNFTDTPTSLVGLHLCQGADCFELPDAVVEAGETVRIAVGDGAGHEDVIATHATLGELHPADGEIALMSSPEPEDPQAMFIYFQWGSTPHELTQAAIDAGLWIEGGYGPSSQNATRLYKVAETGLWLFEEP